METFKRMVNDCIRIGLQNNASSLKRLSVLSYSQLSHYQIYGNYKLTAISKAAGILKARKKSIRRGFPTKDPHMLKPLLVGYLGFKVIDGILRIPITASGSGRNTDYYEIPLNNHVKTVLSDRSLKVHSFSINADGVLSLTVSNEVE